MLKNLLLISGFSTFVVIIIIGLDIYHGYTVSQLPDNTQKHVLPIAPNFDKKTLNELKKRIPIPVSLDAKSEAVSADAKDAQSTPTPIPTVLPNAPATGSGSLIGL